MHLFNKFLLILLAILAFNLSAEITSESMAQVLKLSEQANVKRFPNADSVLLFDNQHIIYQTDGSAVTTDDFFVKVLTEAGRSKLRKQSFYFNITYEEFKLEACDVLKANGQIVKIDVAKNSKLPSAPAR